MREALGGSRRDLTAMPLSRAIVLLAVPMVLEMVMESIFAVADIFWVSKLGADAVAAVGLTESLLTIVYAVGMGMAMGVGAVVARRIGAKDHEGASRAAVQAIFIGLGLAAVLGVVGGLFAPTLLAAMGASPAVMAVGAGYARLMLAGDVTILLLFLINAAFRGAGDAAITMRALWLANGINILLGPLFVFGLGPFPRLGVTGAAVATTIGRSIGVLFLLRALARGKGRLVGAARAPAPRPRDDEDDLPAGQERHRADADRVHQLDRPGEDPGGVRQRAAGRLHDRHAGGDVHAPAVVGARQRGGDAGRAEPGRGQPGARRGGGLAGGVLQLRLPRRRRPPVGAVRRHGGPPVHARSGRRRAGGPVPAHRRGRLRVLRLRDGRHAGVQRRRATRGRRPRINLGCFWLGEIPLALLLARGLGLGPTGVYVAITAAFSAVAVVSITLFRRGRWKTVKV